MTERRIIVVGAGLVGSLLSIFLARRGYHTEIFERRPDNRKSGNFGGRSINLALSDRGLLALQKAGITSELSALMVPMYGRSIHLAQGEVSFQPYGQENQAINSISRSQLNMILIKKAEEAGAKCHFQRTCKEIDFSRSEIVFEDADGNHETIGGDIIIGADGAFSAVREAMLKTDRFEFDQVFMNHGYKELSIPPGPDLKFHLEPGALHIWPRERFMLIALPNIDRSFTCTLFLPFEGENSFSSLASSARIRSFFKKFFPDATPLLSELEKEFAENPTSSLVTIRCKPWTLGNVLLVGDASHAIVPFYGQGMNAGFEDCRIIDDMIGHYQGDWTKVLSEFSTQRKPDADAIRDLALQNFVEMAELVASPQFLLRKKIEAHLNKLFPQLWIPQYSQVTFSHIPYSAALADGEIKKRIMDEIMGIPEIETNWKDLDFQKWVNKLAL